MTSEAGKQAAAPSSLRLVLTLAIAGLVSGVAIVGIYRNDAAHHNRQQGARTA